MQTFISVMRCQQTSDAYIGIRLVASKNSIRNGKKQGTPVNQVDIREWAVVVTELVYQIVSRLSTYSDTVRSARWISAMSEGIK